MRVGIIGGGFSGMCLATKLSKHGNEVSVFEKEKQLGGLATWQDFGTFHWDRFYHVILPNDKYLLSFLEECGLKDQVNWKRTRTGYYVDNHFYSISSNKEFLLFPPLDLISKIRLAFTIYYGSTIKDWKKLEKISVQDWLIKLGGSKNYHKFWKPLLLAKLGDYHDKVSAVFIWTYIKRLFEARENANKEQLGFITGGYRLVFNRLEELVKVNNGYIHLNTTVDRIEPSSSGKIKVLHQGVENEFDKVIFTGPTTLINRMVSTKLAQVEDRAKIDYLGVVCTVLITRCEISPYYVLNIADKKIPFTGVIGMSSLVDLQYTGDQYITYFPKYIKSSDPLLTTDDEQIEIEFMKGFSALYPEFKKSDIVSIHIHRAKRVQPLQVMNYSDRVPSITTLHPNFFVLNTSQFVNDTLNNNSVAKHVQRFLEENQHFASKDVTMLNEVN